MRIAVLAASLLLTGAVHRPQSRPDDPRIYVANQEVATVSVIDARTNELLETVDMQKLGFSAKCKPHDTAVEPDGSYWYVTLIADGYIVKLDRDDHVVAKAPFETPGLLALDKNSDLLFVGRSMAAVNPPHRIGIIHRKDMSIKEVDVFVPRPHAIAVDPRGRYAYVGSLAENQMAVVDTQTDEATLQQIPGDSTHVIVDWAVSPNGQWLVGSGQMTGQMVVFDATDPLHLKFITMVKVNAWPWHPAFTPDGSEVWVGNQRANSVTVIDARFWKVADVITGEGLAEPHGIAIRPDDKYVYVSNHNLQGTYKPTTDRGGNGTGTVVVIDRATRKIVKVIETDRYAAGMSIQGGR